MVGTPIGNLGDITLRAVATLQQVPRIVAEDTRRTRTLLTHLGIARKPLDVLDAHASERTLERLVAHLAAGEDVALVTDAGMPGVSDPGGHAVRAAVAAGIKVVVVPGPSAVTAAVALSGVVESALLFLGFLPRKGQKRREALARIQGTAEPVVLLEAPGRAAETLGELAALAPTRAAVVCRELTKLHEETARGSLGELAQRDDWRGEVVIVLGAAPDAAAPRAPAPSEQEAEVRRLLAAGVSVRDVTKELAVRWDVPRREVYALARAVAGAGERAE